MHSKEFKKSTYIWTTFARKFVTQNFQKSPNLVTLVETSFSSFLGLHWVCQSEVTAKHIILWLADWRSLHKTVFLIPLSLSLSLSSSLLSNLFSFWPPPYLVFFPSKMGHPRPPLSFIFVLLKQTLQFLQPTVEAVQESPMLMDPSPSQQEAPSCNLLTVRGRIRVHSLHYWSFP